MTPTRMTAVLLILSGINLALMIPGGFVETRSFPGYGLMILGAFNVVLTLLGLGSLVLGYRLIRTRRGSGTAALLGLGFASVYLLDLGGVFPIAQEPMSVTLFTLEWLGVVLGFAAAAAAIGAIRQRDATRTAKEAILPRWSLAALGLAALAIVIFATLSAA